MRQIIVMVGALGLGLFALTSARAQQISGCLKNGKLEDVSLNGVPSCKANETPVTWFVVDPADIAALNARLQALEDALACVSMASDADDFFFEGCNVHVRNDHPAQSTDPVNGFSNLIIGYDEGGNPVPICSDGAFDNQTDCEDNGGVWAADQKSGSHNLIVGRWHNYTQFGGLVAGRQNTINGREASVSGGNIKTASGLLSSVRGGTNNTASGEGSNVSGGADNTASGSLSSVSGGDNNAASGAWSSVSGGRLNTASGDFSSVSGGFQRSAPDLDDWAAGTRFEDF